MFDKFKRNNSATTKIIMIGVLILALMIPTQFVRGIILERQARQGEAVYEVSEKWGNAQIVEGPVVTVPYLKWPKADKNLPGTLGYAHLLPDTLNIDGQLLPQIRSRGIFEVPLYTADLKLTGTFSKNTSLIPVPASQILWGDAKVSLGLSDVRGLREQVRMDFNGAEITLHSGLSSKDFFQSGIVSNISGFGDKETSAFSLHLMLNGSQNLSFTPMGKETKVQLNSEWKDPSFYGGFLPVDHSITEKGFTAQWSVLDVNRNYPQVWIEENNQPYSNSQYQTSDSQFGVKLFTPVNHYQQTTRAVKYAILFITLTFLAFFLVEILNHFTVHPVQYLLVGFAIVLFYLLLLSLSEQIGFTPAYLLASGAIVGMVSLYSGSVLHIKKMGYLIGLLLALLYLFLYFLLRLEDFALILGSIGLFIILSAVMYLTRNIDWYSLKNAE